MTDDPGWFAEPDVVGVFRDAARDARTVLEVGALEWTAGESTVVAPVWIPDAQLVASDIRDGPGVDVAADAHDLAPFADGTFAAYIARSVWEHLERPWLAAAAAFRVLAPGGVAYVDAPHTFPLHGYPSDFLRFSTAALEVIMVDAGFEVLASGYRDRCDVRPRTKIAGWNDNAPAWLFAQVAARKPSSGTVAYEENER